MSLSQCPHAACVLNDGGACRVERGIAPDEVPLIFSRGGGIAHHRFGDGRQPGCALIARLLRAIRRRDDPRDSLGDLFLLCQQQLPRTSTRYPRLTVGYLMRAAVNAGRMARRRAPFPAAGYREHVLTLARTRDVESDARRTVDELFTVYAFRYGRDPGLQLVELHYLHQLTLARAGECLGLRRRARERLMQRTLDRLARLLDRIAA